MAAETAAENSTLELCFDGEAYVPGYTIFSMPHFGFHLKILQLTKDFL